MGTTERFDVVVIGGGQQGLAAGWHLRSTGRSFVILDAHDRVGDAWRGRWDSLRLFTPARHSGLPGWTFPAAGWSFPTKDDMAAYLEAYAERFSLPVRTGVRVEELCERGGRYVARAGTAEYVADDVIVATGGFPAPRIPAFVSELDPTIHQLHSSAYRNPSSLVDGPVLVVGAGNSGAEIALESARDRKTWLAGRHPGHIPFDTQGFMARILLERIVLRVVFHRLLTLDTPLGRRAKPKVLSQGMNLIRVRPKDYDEAGVERVPRVAGVRDGRPHLDDGRVLEPANVVWATGYDLDWSWARVPGFGAGEPEHRRGVVAGAPGVYVLGLEFLYSFSSEQIQGTLRDPGYVVSHLDQRPRATSGRHEAIDVAAPSS